MRRSWEKRKSAFPIILTIICFLHGAFFALKIQQKMDEKQATQLIVKLQSDPFKNKTQIVQSEDSDVKKKMDDAYYSDKDRFFDRETQARKNDIFKAGSAGGGKAQSGQPKLDFKTLGADVGVDPFKKAAKDYNHKKNGKNDDESVQKVSSTNDFLAEVPLGDMTNLNTVEYKYYGFYHRIRQKLEQFWGRSLYEKADQMIKDGRRVPASENLITALEITLDHQGEIIAIKIMGTSGIKELDDAAIESFNDAGPFPNPPKGLVVNGKVKLEWGFVVRS